MKSHAGAREQEGPYPPAMPVQPEQRHGGAQQQQAKQQELAERRPEEDCGNGLERAADRVGLRHVGALHQQPRGGGEQCDFRAEPDQSPTGAVEAFGGLGRQMFDDGMRKHRAEQDHAEYRERGRQMEAALDRPDPVRCFQTHAGTLRERR